MYQLIEATFLAAKCMMQSEMGFTTVAASWKVWWCDAVSHEESITELLG
jgi:hypothetical protein